MAFKVVLLCVSALLVQSIADQCCGGSGKYGNSGIYGNSGKYGSLGNYGNAGSVSVSNSGGDFLVTSVGPISPSGISVDSQLDLIGDLDVRGELPFLSAVEFATTLDTKGSACVDYSCGACGKVAIDKVIGNSHSGYGSGYGNGHGSDCGCKL